MHYCAKTSDKVRNTTAFTFLWLWNSIVICSTKCHGSKGWGLDTKGGCKGAFSMEEFQLMVDPLDAAENLVKEMKVSVHFI